MARDDRGGETVATAADPGTAAAVEHDPEGLELAELIAKTARGGNPRRRKPTRRRPEHPLLSGSRPDDRDPQPLGAALDRVTAERGWTTDLSVHLVMARWSDLVGPVLAEHSRPEAWADGVLTVRADSTAWATQLRMLVRPIVARLNEELGDGTVRLVDVKGPDAPSWKHGPRSVRDGRGPRDTYG